VTDIAAILLVPRDEDPHGLLREGPCGARPPMAYRPYNERGRTHYPRWVPFTSDYEVMESPPFGALVLAYQGEVVVEGCDRLDWCQHDGRAGTFPGRERRWSHTPEVPGLPENLWKAWEHAYIACHVVRPPLGRIVLLNEAGEEIER